jgi:hypothetical protein
LQAQSRVHGFRDASGRAHDFVRGLPGDAFDGEPKRSARTEIGNVHGDYDCDAHAYANQCQPGLRGMVRKVA